MKKTKVCSVLLALIMAFIMLSTLGLVRLKASAEEDEATPSPTQKDFYYFSDNKECGNLYNLMLPILHSSYNITDMYLKDWSEETSEKFRNYLAMESETIRDAYIVFELRHGIEGLGDYGKFGEDRAETYLLSMFETWKSNNCDIMFICNTEESRFTKDDYNQFLDFVDIHVNTDIMSLIMTQLLEEIETGCGFDGYTFIINRNAYYILRSFILPYFGIPMGYNHEAYLDEYGQINAKSYMGFMKSGVTKVYFVVQNENGFNYYDSYSDSEISDLSEIADRLDPDKTCAIGEAWNPSDYSEYSVWLNSLKNIQEQYGMTFPVYAVNGTGIYMGWENFHEADGAIYNFYWGAYNILSDFISGSDLSKYNNWDGLCHVTYKTLTFGERGWLHVTAASDTFDLDYKM